MLAHCNYHYSVKELVNSKMSNKLTPLKKNLFKYFYPMKLRGITELVLDFTLFQINTSSNQNLNWNLGPSLNTVNRSAN